MYTDLRTLKDGTVFRVENGAWKGVVFSKHGKKYVHVYDTGKNHLISGDENLIITIEDEIDLRRILFKIDRSEWVFPLAFRLLCVGNNKRPYSFIIHFLCFELIFCIDDDSYNKIY